MTRKTILNESHRALGAKMVDFGGWDMPLNYGSQIDEHHAVRQDAGMFDVSHMTVVDMRGPRTRKFLRHLLANNVDKLKNPGKALYSCMLNAEGGVIDDLIVYFVAEDFFRTVVNASTRDKDLAWINQQAQAFDVEINERSDLAMIAVQGPHARSKAASVLADEIAVKALKLGKFVALQDGELFIARTGYTGEDGFEIMVAEDAAIELWSRFVAAGIQPAGLGARDTLRLEAGMNLYGQDMDESITPWEAGLAWTVSLDTDRDFIGRSALESQKSNGVTREMVGIIMDEKGVLRHGQTVLTESGNGEILSGTFSPTLGKAIAFARIPPGVHAHVRVDIRGREVPVRVVKYPFVRDGQPVTA